MGIDLINARLVYGLISTPWSGFRFCRTRLRRDASPGDAEGFYRAVLLDRRNARSVRFYAAADVSSRAEPPGLMLSAIAESVVTTPFTSDWPVPPNVSMPRRASNRPMGRLI